MATLEKIRSKMGVLAAAVIGLSLLAFILGDFFDSRQSFINQSRMNAGEVNGKSIRIDEYNSRVEETTTIYKAMYGNENVDEAMQENIKETVWQQLVQEYVMSDQFEKTGLAVTSEELYEMVQGSNPHQIAQQFFTNRETGMYDRSRAVQFLKALNAKQLSPEQEQIWLFMEREMHREKMLEKYNNLVSKGLYVTKLQSKLEFQGSARKADIRIVSERYNQLPDSTVKFSTRDMKKYYRAHKEEFKQEPSRDIDYITYDIRPTDADYEAAQKWINDLSEEFKTVDSPKDFVNANSDVPFADKNFKQGELTGVADSFAFAAKIGETYGPVFEDESFKTMRLAEINSLPDSVKARHILIQPTANTPEAAKAAQELADSIKGLIEKGQDFATLAMTYSADNGSKIKGGDLGWFKDGAMVKPISDAAFAAKTGVVETVSSQYGIHILQVTERGKETKKVKIAILVRKVEPSKETYDNIYETASKFAANNNTSEKFEAATVKENISKRVAMNIRPGDTRISGLESPRELIRWAYDSKQGAVSGVIALNNKFVIARLTAVRKDEIAPFDQVKSDLETRVRREKKGELLSAKLSAELGKSSSIDALSTALNLKVEEANGVSFSSNAIGSIGFEPAVIGTVSVSEANKLSKPVIGNNGVYIFEVRQVEEAKEADDNTLNMQKSRMQSMSQMRANYESFEALKTLAHVVDNRSAF
jgi:peptidyl-prolyl cis-trans isomerase D